MAQIHEQNAETDHHAELKNPDGSWRYTNALARETSPYLLQHAHNPVDWHAWGPEAFDKARRENKAIFLSIGYSTCYWCHVMERQSFENPAIAAVMNDNFVNIKVDREERPDVDDVYMTATQITTGHGGWPMSVFLTPPGARGADDKGLKPFYAGTYFPPEPGHGRPGFPQLVEALGRAWRERRDDVLTQADDIADAVKAQMERPTEPGELGVATVQRAANQLLRMYDQQHGGFGAAPKFPTPSYLFFLLAVHRNNPDDSLWRVLSHTFDRMARGGMYDQVGGGFHRYSVDAEWLVPHFEKMLYDNGQLVRAYCLTTAQARSDDERGLYRRIIRETCDYVLREMTDESGAFWSAQDAEVEAREGGNYVWTREQVEQAIEDDGLRTLAVRMYGLELGPNFQDPHQPDATPVNVLYLPTPLPELAKELGVSMHDLDAQRRMINARLKEIRDDRPQPGTDDKVLVSWNGLMIAALAEAGRTLEEPRYVEAAARAADAIVQRMSAPGESFGLLRTMRKGDAKIPAFLEDYALFVHGLLALHRTQPAESAPGAGSRWLALAKSYTRAAEERFAAPDGGYFDTLADQADLFVRTRGSYDGAIPSGNSVMVHNLLDLYEETRDRDYLERALRDLRSFGGALHRGGAGMSLMQQALLRALELAPEAMEAAAGEGTATAGVVSASIEPATVRWKRGGDTESDVAEATLVLDIGEGYHINGRETHEGLIPTRVALAGAPEGIGVDVRFPEPKLERYPFAEEAIPVYVGRVKVPLRIRKTASQSADVTLRFVVSYQACTESACLAPNEVVAELNIQ